LAVATFVGFSVLAGSAPPVDSSVPNMLTITGREKKKRKLPVNASRQAATDQGVNSPKKHAHRPATSGNITHVIGLIYI
jgi:hypothetical protein